MRVEKTLETRGGTFGLYVDALTATNQGIATSVTALSGPRFGRPLTWSHPRTVRAAIRWTF